MRKAGEPRDTSRRFTEGGQSDQPNGTSGRRCALAFGRANATIEQSGTATRAVPTQCDQESDPAFGKNNCAPPIL